MLLIKVFTRLKCCKILYIWIRATQDEVVKSICSYAIENNYVWSIETIFDNYEYTTKTLENLGEDSKALLTDMADESGNEAFKSLAEAG